MPTWKLPRWIAPTVLAGAMLARIAYAKDMVGPDGLELLMALPKVALYAIGELSLVLAPLLGLLAILSWIVSRGGLCSTAASRSKLRRPRRLSSQVGGG